MQIQIRIPYIVGVVSLALFMRIYDILVVSVNFSIFLIGLLIVIKKVYFCCL